MLIVFKSTFHLTGGHAIHLCSSCLLSFIRLVLVETNDLLNVLKTEFLPLVLHN